MLSYFLPEGLILVTNGNVMLVLQQPRQACTRSAKVLENVQCLGDKLVGGCKRREGNAAPGMASPSFEPRVTEKQMCGWSRRCEVQFDAALRSRFVMIRDPCQLIGSGFEPRRVRGGGYQFVAGPAEDVSGEIQLSSIDQKVKVLLTTQFRPRARLR